MNKPNPFSDKKFYRELIAETIDALYSQGYDFVIDEKSYEFGGITSMSERERGIFIGDLLQTGIVERISGWNNNPVLQISDYGLRMLRKHGSYKKARWPIQRNKLWKDVKREFNEILASIQTVVTIISICLSIVLSILLIRKKDIPENIQPAITRLENKLDSLIDNLHLQQSQPVRQEKPDSTRQN